ncbi:MAG: hypothetical protein EAZ57_04615 [Cytophagales bacterium]|nr:MAG: hypothetical protein EAZ67_01265 [Cytophagales bacterium]TAF61076.1 MAG: hypothetical protein EAZ57_04615 [Cytophagales bacterium]
MRHLLGFVFLFLFTFSSSFAAEFNAPNATATSTAPKTELSAKELGEKVRSARGGKKLNLVERTALKMVSKKIEKAQVKAKKEGKEVQAGDIKSLLKTFGLIFMIVGLVLILLSVLSVLTGGVNIASGSGLFVLGLILYLVAVYAL